MWLHPEQWSIHFSIVMLLMCAIVITVLGVRLTKDAEKIAHLTGLGQALIGAVFLGMITSLAGSITSVNAALNGAVELSVGNAVGGIAAQTTFLVFADLLYRKSNLEYAAASEQNLFQIVLLILLLAIPLLATFSPGVTLLNVDVFSIILVATYFSGIYLVSESRHSPKWVPHDQEAAERPFEPLNQKTPHQNTANQESTFTLEDEPIARLWGRFIFCAIAISVAGWLTSHAGISVSEKSGLSQSIVGTLFTAIVTSLPELVVALSAVRNGALMLAVGNIIGGNSFDVLFLAASDVAYQEGSIYLAMRPQQQFWLSLNIILSAIILLGMIKRQKHGTINIGFEGVLVLGCYLASVVLLFWGQ